MKLRNVCQSLSVHASRAFLLGFAVGITPCLGQSFAAPPAPPGTLPPLLSECENGTNYNACGVWVWDGSAYSAIWGNHAAGRITVTSEGPSQVTLQRADTAGTLAGLSATYTAKWDGKTFTGGKFAFTFKGTAGTFNWTANPAVTPVVMNPDPNLQSYINWYPVQLTGFSVFNWDYDGSSINDFRIRRETPMNPGEDRHFSPRTGREPANYVKGANYPKKSAIAAIYADGTTFGDSNVLMEMVHRRQSMIAALTAMGNTVCTLGLQQISTTELETALNKQHAEEDARSASGKEERDIAYTTVWKTLALNVHNRLPPAQAIKKTFDQLNQYRSNLADPIKDAHGQLLIPPVTPLSCSLP